MRHKEIPNENSVLTAWTVALYINKINYKELIGKSEEFQKGFLCAIESLREELIKVSGCD